MEIAGHHSFGAGLQLLVTPQLLDRSSAIASLSSPRTRPHSYLPLVSMALSPKRTKAGSQPGSTRKQPTSMRPGCTAIGKTEVADLPDGLLAFVADHDR